MSSILVLTGSPRTGGNTDLLADAFIKGAKRAGHTIERFDAGRARVNGCRGCDACFSNGKPCAFDDDFNTFAEMFQRADALVIATPVYFFSFTAQIKAVIDKLYAFTKTEGSLGIKKTVLLAVAADDNRAVFDGLIKSYELIFDYLKWEDRGRLLVDSVGPVGDILNYPDLLTEAERLGAEI